MLFTGPGEAEAVLDLAVCTDERVSSDLRRLNSVITSGDFASTAFSKRERSFRSSVFNCRRFDNSLRSTTGPLEFTLWNRTELIFLTGSSETKAWYQTHFGIKQKLSS
jgi:hypothetical protein